ncbi:MAG: hypothetical protein AABX40_00285 [Candidatus Hydrothermarchaeota archaeon]
MVGKLLIALFFLSALPGVYAISYAVEPFSPASVDLKTGQSTIITFSVANNNTLFSIATSYRLDDYPPSAFTTIAPGGVKMFTVPVAAPPRGLGSGSMEHTVVIRLQSYNPLDRGIYNASLTFLINYDDSEYQQEVQARATATTGINIAQNAIDFATASLNIAKKVLQDAVAIGANTSEADSLVASSQGHLLEARVRLDGANRNLNNGSYSRATSLANEAENLANVAKGEAEKAYSLADQAKSTVITEKGDALRALNSAMEALELANSTIVTAGSTISSAREIGINTTRAEVLLSDAQERLREAGRGYREAKKRFDGRSYQVARTMADEVTANATEARGMAFLAEETAVKERRSLLGLEEHARLGLKAAHDNYNLALGLSDGVTSMLKGLSKMGLSTESFKENLKGSMKLLAPVKEDLDKAQDAYNGGTFDASRSYSTRALNASRRVVEGFQVLSRAIAQTAKDTTYNRQGEAEVFLETASQTLSANNATLPPDVYSGQEETLGAARGMLQGGRGLMREADAHFERGEYQDAVELYRSTYDQLTNASLASRDVEAAVGATIQAQEIARQRSVLKMVGSGALLLLVLAIVLYRRRKKAEGAGGGVGEFREL